MLILLDMLNSCFFASFEVQCWSMLLGVTWQPPQSTTKMKVTTKANLGK